MTKTFEIQKPKRLFCKIYDWIMKDQIFGSNLQTILYRGSTLDNKKCVGGEERLPYSHCKEEIKKSQANSEKDFQVDLQKREEAKND